MTPKLYFVGKIVLFRLWFGPSSQNQWFCVEMQETKGKCYLSWRYLFCSLLTLIWLSTLQWNNIEDKELWPRISFRIAVVTFLSVFGGGANERSNLRVGHDRPNLASLFDKFVIPCDVDAYIRTTNRGNKACRDETKEGHCAGDGAAAACHGVWS